MHRLFARTATCDAGHCQAHLELAERQRRNEDVQHRAKDEGQRTAKHSGCRQNNQEGQEDVNDWSGAGGGISGQVLRCISKLRSGWRDAGMQHAPQALKEYAWALQQSDSAPASSERSLVRSGA